tara:strand:- start:53 stop:934 length:882 start_codon:yes stop_codon:yes gene_type:complete
MRYLSSNDVAEILGINISTLKRWTDSGIIGCSKTAGGHRKFTMQHVRDYYSDNKNADKNLGLGLERLEHKRIYDLINKSKYEELAKILADSSLESNDLTVSTVINGSYMKGISPSEICDKIVDPGSMIVENALQQKYITHIEAFISRKLITRVVESLNQNKPNGSYNGKTALCINFEDNLPDLGVVMSEVILRHNGYNVLNTGSHAELGNLKEIIKKRSVNLLLFYLCDMQCCMATVQENLSKTALQVKEIVKLAKNLDVEVIFGGSGIQFLLGDSKQISNTFLKYSELEKII